MSKVTHKMLEILGLVARMPIGYRRIRKKELKVDYVKHLQECNHALEAFYLLIEERKESEVSEKAILCYRGVLKNER